LSKQSLLIQKRQHQKLQNKVNNNLPFISEKYTHDIVTLEQARQWLRMDIPGYEEEDSVIEMAVESAISRVEEECNLSLGISEYTWNTQYLPCEFKDTFYVKNITSIEYRSGSSFLLAPEADYELIQVSKRRSEILWNSNVNYQSNRIRLKFTAGFEEGEVPPILLQAIRAIVSEQFDNRGDGVLEKKTLSDKLMDKVKIGYAG